MHTHASQDNQIGPQIQKKVDISCGFLELTDGTLWQRTFATLQSHLGDGPKSWRGPGWDM